MNVKIELADQERLEQLIEENDNENLRKSIVRIVLLIGATFIFAYEFALLKEKALPDGLLFSTFLIFLLLAALTIPMYKYQNVDKAKRLASDMKEDGLVKVSYDKGSGDVCLLYFNHNNTMQEIEIDVDECEMYDGECHLLQGWYSEKSGRYVLTYYRPREEAWKEI